MNENMKLADASARQIQLIVDLLEETRETWRRIRDLDKSLANCHATIDSQKIAISRYRRAFKYLPCGVYMKDADKRYLFCNDACARMMNLRPQDFQGKTDHDLFPEETALRWSAGEKLVSPSGPVAESEEKHRVAGEERTLLVARRIVSGDEADVAYLLGILVDITEIKRREEALQADLERQFSVRKAELEKWSNGLRQHLTKLEGLKNIIDSTKTYLDSLEESA